jgi:hypothetical protein
MPTTRTTKMQHSSVMFTGRKLVRDSHACTARSHAHRYAHRYTHPINTTTTQHNTTRTHPTTTKLIAIVFNHSDATPRLRELEDQAQCTCPNCEAPMIQSTGGKKGHGVSTTLTHTCSSTECESKVFTCSLCLSRTIYHTFSVRHMRALVHLVSIVCIVPVLALRPNNAASDVENVFFPCACAHASIDPHKPSLRLHLL